jgi:transcriptional regulator with XRE-family HTH domain
MIGRAFVSIVMKTCPKCNTEKELSEFYKSNKCYCKECFKKYVSDRYKNGDQVKQKKREWKNNNQDNIKKYNQSYYERNKKPSAKKAINSVLCKSDTDVACINFKLIRIKAGLTQKMFAERLGIKTPHVKGIEQGRFVPNLNILRKLAVEFKVSLDAVVGLSNTVKITEQEKAFNKAFDSTPIYSNEIELSKTRIELNDTYS